MRIGVRLLPIHGPAREALARDVAAELVAFAGEETSRDARAAAIRVIALAERFLEEQDAAIARALAPYAGGDGEPECTCPDHGGALNAHDEQCPFLAWHRGRAPSR